MTEIQSTLFIPPIRSSHQSRSSNTYSPKYYSSDLSIPISTSFPTPYNNFSPVTSLLTKRTLVTGFESCGYKKVKGIHQSYAAIGSNFEAANLCSSLVQNLPGFDKMQIRVEEPLFVNLEDIDCTLKARKKNDQNKKDTFKNSMRRKDYKLVSPKKNLENSYPSKTLDIQTPDHLQEALRKLKQKICSTLEPVSSAESFITQQSQSNKKTFDELFIQSSSGETQQKYIFDSRKWNDTQLYKYKFQDIESGRIDLSQIKKLDFVNFNGFDEICVDELQSTKLLKIESDGDEITAETNDETDSTMSLTESKTAEKNAQNVQKSFQSDNNAKFPEFIKKDKTIFVIKKQNISLDQLNQECSKTMQIQINNIQSPNNSLVSEYETIRIQQTPVGQKYQVQIPPFQVLHQSLRKRRNPRIVWNPDSISEAELETYFAKLQNMLKANQNQEKAIKLLRESNRNPNEVFQKIQGKEKSYLRMFTIRPKRRP